MVFVGAGLGENLNAAVAKFVVFGRERVLVNADLANRRLRWKLTGGESVDIDLPAVGTGGWTGQRLQVRLQFVGIIGKGLKVFS